MAVWTLDGGYEGQMSLVGRGWNCVVHGWQSSPVCFNLLSQCSRILVLVTKALLIKGTSCVPETAFEEEGEGGQS